MQYREWPSPFKLRTFHINGANKKKKRSESQIVIKSRVQSIISSFVTNNIDYKLETDEEDRSWEAKLHRPNLRDGGDMPLTRCRASRVLYKVTAVVTRQHVPPISVTLR